MFHVESSCRGNSLSRNIQTPLIPVTSSSSSDGTPGCSEGQPRDTDHPGCPGSSWGASFLVGHSFNTSPRRHLAGIGKRCQSIFSRFLSTWRSSGSTPSSALMTELLTLSLRVIQFLTPVFKANPAPHPVLKGNPVPHLVSKGTPNCFGHLHLQSSSIGHH